MASSVTESTGSFIIDRVVPLPDLQLVLTEAHHKPTGARIIHLSNDDPENLFCISLRTEPQASHGVAHILEHLVLCGSKRYPIHDPFMAMGRRSLHTFLNAFTGADFTAYPAASLISKDLDHLFEVYLDAVFRPLLRDENFRQEGWRVEFEKMEDASSPLTFRGVVYNEMKGAMGSPESRCWKELMSELFPDLTYRVNSGGDPVEIPTLSVEELRRFHQEFYHPGRSILFFYGNRPLEEYLPQLEHCLEEFPDHPAPLPPIPPQPRFTEPKWCESTYPSEQSGQILLAMGWLTTSIMDLDQQLALELLQMVLMGTDASPLKRALMESELCQDVDSTFEDEMSEAPFVLMFRGLPAKQTEKAAHQLEQLTLDALKQIVRDGIPAEQLVGALDQLELQKLEITGDDGPFGLSLYWRSILPMQHGAPAEYGLGFHGRFDRLRRSLENPQFLAGIIQQQLIDNPHRVTLLIRPDPKKTQEEVASEAKALADLEKTLTTQDREKLVTAAVALKKQQETPQDLTCLPCLQLTDVPQEIRTYALREERAGDTRLFHHEVFTNGITTVELYLPQALPDPEGIFWSRLASSWLSECGFGGRPFTETLQDLLAYTGGISAGGGLYPSAHDPKQWSPAFCLRGKALERHVPKMLQLMREMLLQPDFSDLERLAELLDQEWSHIETSLSRLAHRFAHQLAGARFSPASAVDVTAAGLGYVRTLKQLVDEGPKALPRIAEKLKAAAEGWLCGPAQIVASCSGAAWEQLQKEGFGGLTSLSLKAPGVSAAPPGPTPQEIPAFVIDGRVAYVALALPTPGYVDPRSSLL
ncbi:MAG: insulinase family protein, partial [Chlamydiia bacterium]